MPIHPVRFAPSSNQRGLSAQRLSGMFFNNSQATDGTGFASLQPLPKVLGPGVSLTTEVMEVIGFNTFMALLDVLTNNIAFKLNHVSPVDGVTIFATRTIATVAAGGGFTVINLGYGNPSAQAGFDVFAFVSFTFTNTSGAGNATINQFPGLWGAVR